MDEITMVPVVSSNIAAIGWLKGTLRVEFISGQTWDYQNVSENEYASMLQSPSIGRYFHQHIKGRYNETQA